MGKKHDSQYANFGWLHGTLGILIIYANQQLKTSSDS